MCVAPVCGLGALLAAGCGDEPAGRQIVTSFYPLEFAASQVAPDGVDVTNLTPPGAEPHDLELDARDVASLRDASLVVYVGGGFQPAVEDALEERDGPSHDILGDLRIRLGSRAGPNDPHVWLDPIRFGDVARGIAAELGDPDAADALVDQLEALDAEFRRGLARCERRELVTSHAAFGYLAASYGLEQVPLVGLEPEAEPRPRDVERLVDRVRVTGATTVYFETLASPELAETVAREAGVETAVLDPLEGLSADELASGTDYFDVMRENLAALRAGLGCT